MKRRSALLVLLLLPAVLFAQTIQASKLDMSGAEAFPAGPDRVYVRGIVYDGNPVSVILSFDGKNGAEVLGPFVDTYGTDTVDLSRTSFKLSEKEMLEISGVIVGNTAFRGLFKRNGATGLTLTEYSRIALPETAEAQLSRLETERAQLEANLASLTTERDRAVSDLAAAKAAAAQATAAREAAQAAADRAAAAQAAAEKALAMPEKAVFKGFRPGSALIGTWKESSGSITQTDRAQKLAAYAIPVPELSQIRTDTLFSFKAASTSTTAGNGFGMHFAESAQGTAAFGFGNSFLLWVTSNATGGAFLQLYGAGDRINQIASFRLGEKLPGSLEIGLLFRPSSNRVELLVGGQRKAEFDAAGIGLPGTTLVLRTFGGPVTFSDFTVQVK